MPEKYTIIGSKYVDLIIPVHEEITRRDSLLSFASPSPAQCQELDPPYPQRRQKGSLHVCNSNYNSRIINNQQDKDLLYVHFKTGTRFGFSSLRRQMRNLRLVFCGSKEKKHAALLWAEISLGTHFNVTIQYVFKKHQQQFSDIVLGLVNISYSPLLQSSLTTCYRTQVPATTSGNLNLLP